MKCENCEYLKDVFGNFVQCVKTGRFLNYEYWNNVNPTDCPLDSKGERKNEKSLENGNK